jgi:BASS family bile acid:Na+ symporter
MGLVLVACCPGGSSSNVFSMLAKGDVALSITLTAISSLVTLITLPFIMNGVAEFVSQQNNTEVVLPVGKLLVQNIVLLFAPMLLGIVLRHFRPETAKKVNRILGKCAFPALMLLAGVFFLQYTKEIMENFSILGVAATALILIAMICSSILSKVGKFTAGVRRTIVIEVGMQNAAQAIAIASSPLIFNSDKLAIPAIIYALIMNIILLAYVAFIRKFR